MNKSKAKRLGLPESVDMEIDSCLADAIEDVDYLEETMNNYLSDTYGWCMNGYNYEIDGDIIHITNIDWDLTIE